MIFKEKGIKRRGIPSDPSWENMNISWAEAEFTWEGRKSDKFDEIAAIVGRNNIKDVKHLDTAYKNGCSHFITNDKTDIVKNKTKLEKLLNLKIFYSDELLQGSLEEREIHKILQNT